MNNRKLSTTSKNIPAGHGRPVKNYIMNLQTSIAATPKNLEKAILTTAPRKNKT
ncbi:MAG: hypothetical protein OXL40_00700 [Bacteroidota bacterium]|nr:hypothetical protein [Bacteroidota bacterium]